jgi:hypothetical protein
MKTVDLEEIYVTYPRRIGKGAAIKAIEKAIHRLKGNYIDDSLSARSADVDS